MPREGMEVLCSRPPYLVLSFPAGFPELYANNKLTNISVSLSSISYSSKLLIPGVKGWGMRIPEVRMAQDLRLVSEVGAVLRD